MVLYAGRMNSLPVLAPGFDTVLCRVLGTVLACRRVHWQYFHDVELAAVEPQLDFLG
jgi:hypothetical protein